RQAHQVVVRPGGLEDVRHPVILGPRRRGRLDGTAGSGTETVKGPNRRARIERHGTMTLSTDPRAATGHVRWSKSPRTQAAWRCAERSTTSRASAGTTPSKLLYSRSNGRRATCSATRSTTAADSGMRLG